MEWALFGLWKMSIKGGANGGVGRLHAPLSAVMITLLDLGGAGGDDGTW